MHVIAQTEDVAVATNSHGPGLMANAYHEEIYRGNWAAIEKRNRCFSNITQAWIFYC